MARRAPWQYTLAESRRQALVAIDFYNRPGDRRSFSDFIVHIHLAWQNLLHADRVKRGEEIYYAKGAGKGKRYETNPDGSRKTWDLSRCIKAEFVDQDPVRLNIQFFIGLRNHVEHHFQDQLLEVTAPEAHACIINFEAELVRRFGENESLGADLKFPVFIQSLKPATVKEQNVLRRGVPSSATSYITDFQAAVPDAVRSDERFAYRLLLLPMKGPKTEADMALNFVRQEDLSEEDLKALLGSRGSVIVAEKYRDAVHLNEMLPKAAAIKVQSRIPFKFSTNDFTILRKKWQIGPAKTGKKKPLPKSDGFAVFSPVINQFVYTPALVDKMAAALDSATKYRTELGKDPTAKPTTDDMSGTDES